MSGASAGDPLLAIRDPRHRLGIEAEELTAQRLAGRGWRVLARRWRVAEGELDLVCVDPAGILVGIEVRARRSARSGSAAESLDRRRIGRLRSALVRYALSPEGRALRAAGLRLDLVAVDRLGAGWRVIRHPGIDGW